MSVVNFSVYVLFEGGVRQADGTDEISSLVQVVAEAAVNFVELPFDVMNVRS